MAINDRVMDRIQRQASQRARTIAGRVAQLANEFAPVDEDPPASHVGDGRLKGSYHVQAGRYPNWLVVSSQPYWHFVEYGTERSPARPHLRRAIEAVRRELA